MGPSLDLMRPESLCLYVGCDNLMIDFTVCQLLGHGQAAVPVFSAEVNSIC